jgi:hypothetical protein
MPVPEGHTAGHVLRLALLNHVQVASDNPSDASTGRAGQFEGTTSFMPSAPTATRWPLMWEYS